MELTFILSLTALLVGTSDNTILKVKYQDILQLWSMVWLFFSQMVSTVDVVFEWDNVLQDGSHGKNSTHSHLLVVDIEIQKLSPY